MKICSLSIVHYGKNYLPYALQSILPIIDKAGIFYTSNPSHGTQLNIPPIETKQEILDCLPKSDKIEFIDSSGFKQEGHHRNFAKQYIMEMWKPDYILVLDYDEIWPEETLVNVFNFLETSLYVDEKHHEWLINFTHLWRSFDECCRDNMWPIRIIDCYEKEGTGYIPKELGEIYHLGYCVRNDIMRYKWKCHGHIGEIRKNWYQEKWLNYKKGITKDVHPTCENTWSPEPFDKFSLPDFMHLHSFFGLDLIE